MSHDPQHYAAGNGGETVPSPVILQVLPRLVTGGAERGCVDVAAAIVRAGGTALVASAGGPMAYEVERAGGTHITLPLASKSPLVIRRNIGRLAEVMTRHGVHLVHARSRAPAWSAWYACRRLDMPFVTTFHAPYNAQSILKHWYNSVMARGRRVIAISDYVAYHIIETYPIDPLVIRVIPRGIDFRSFAPEQVSGERLIRLAREWRLPEDMPVVLMPGRLTRWKGQTVLLDALARLGRKDIRCLIIGSDQGRTRFRHELEDRIRRLGLDGVVHLTGHCSDMPAAYMLADVVVHASIEPEGFGRVLVEAQAMGRPVIATNIGAPPETVLEGETGWLVPPNNPDVLAMALHDALALDAEDRAAMAARAIPFVRERFSVDRMTAATLAVYEEVLSGATDTLAPAAA